MPDKHQVTEENAGTILNWLRTRGGLAIWGSANPANPGQTWTTPLRNADGTARAEKPHWSAGGIIRTITDPSEVEVVVPREVSRFHVAVRLGTSGLALKLTDASSRCLRRAVARASRQYGAEAWYEFDYGSHKNAVIFVAGEVMSLEEWAKRDEKPVCSAAEQEGPGAS